MKVCHSIKKRSTLGFTLVEIMVATSIFMMIMLISLGSLITSSDTAKKSQAIRSAMDNVNFAMESMTRSIRMGTNYTCVTSFVSLPDSSSSADCALGTAGGGAFAYTPVSELSTNRTVAYNLTERLDHTYTLERCTYNSLTGTTCLDMVSPDINIDKLKFFVTGSNTMDLIQPSVYILIKGTVTIKSQPTTFAIETIVSQRSAE